jgi:hypothetical protein
MSAYIFASVEVTEPAAMRSTGGVCRRSSQASRDLTGGSAAY